MKIKGKIYCFFEQSGTFKREFIKLGYQAEDFDIQDNFGETDHQIDLFHEIEEAYRGGRSVFDQITSDDLIMAFFPCIFFCENNELYFTGKHMNLSRLSKQKKAETILERSRERQRMYELALMLFSVCDMRGLRLIVENPYAPAHYLINNFPYKAEVIDWDRTLRGDFYKKPTQYWFVNTKHTEGYTMQSPKTHKRIASGRPGIRGGICSEDRSMISPDYARNFICDCILGMTQPHIDLQLF